MSDTESTREQLLGEPQTLRSSLGVKLIIAFLALAIIPMSITAYYNLARSRDQVIQVARENLMELSRSTAHRIGWVLEENQRTSATLAGEPAVVQFLAASQDERQALTSQVYGTLQNFADTHPDYDAPGLLDVHGIVVASLEELLLGKDRSFRDYFQASIGGEPYVSDMLVGRATGRPGVFLTNPVTTAEGKIVGIDIVWFKGDTIWDIVDDTAVGEEGIAFLVGQDGVIIAHPNRDLLYHSLGELTPAAVATISTTIRFGTIEGSDTPLIPDTLGMDGLAAKLTSARGSGTYRYRSSLDNRDHVVGYTRLKAHPWTLAVDMPEAQFLAPLQRLEALTWLSVGLAGIIALVTSVLSVQSITRPVLRLTDVASRVERGQPLKPSDIKDITSGRDEIAQLGRVFSNMVLALQRELTERVRAEKAIQRRLAFEETISSVSSRLVHITDLDRAIHASLEDTGKLAGADRAYVFLFRQDGVLMDNTHEWCAEGVSAQIDDLQGLPRDTFPWWMSKLGQDEVVHIPDVSQLPPEAATEKEILESQDIKSLLALPLRIGGELAGFIGLDNVTATGKWGDNDLTLLRLIAEIFGNAFERVRAEEALRESEERYRTISELTSDWTYSFHVESDGSLVLDWMTDAATRIVGFTLEDVKAHGWQGGIHPDDLTIAERKAQTLLSGEPASAEYRMITKSGEIRWVYDYGQPVWDEAQGRVVRIIGATQDITERKQTEEALRAEMERAQQYLDTAGVAFVALDSDGRITLVNRRGLELLGYREAELIGRNWFKTCLPEGLRKEVQAIFQQLMTGEIEPVEYYENQIITKDGKERMVAWHNTVLRNATGDIVGTLSSGEDITGRVRAEEALRESEARFRTLFDGARDGILVADLESQRFQMANRAMRRMLGYSLEEIKRLGVTDIHPEGELSYVLSQFEKQARGEITLAEDIAVARKDGSVFYADVNSSPMSLFGRACLLGIFRDITERKAEEEEKEKIQAQLIQAQKLEAVGRLAGGGGVAHDFNNMLSVIQMGTQLAMKELHEADPMREDLVQVLDAGARAARLTRQLLLFSRREPLGLAALDVNATVTNLLKMLKRLIGEDVAVRTQLAPDLWPVRGDVGQIEQVIMNLAVNSRDAMSQGGHLIIATENVTLDEEYCRSVTDARPGEFVRLSVEDTGTGMTQETRQHLFEPFFTTKAAGVGTGLGLSVVYGIVKQHQGWITVYSEPDQGSTFTVYIPAISGMVGTQARETYSLQELRGGGQRILLVEDEENVQRLLTRALGQNGYVVFAASSAREALETFERERGEFQLLLSDLVLPDGNGLELAEQLLARRPDLRVVLLSGYTDDRVRRTGLREKGFLFIQKPVGVRPLLKVIGEATGSQSDKESG